jgi:hypothetical protein
MAKKAKKKAKKSYRTTSLPAVAPNVARVGTQKKGRCNAGPFHLY